MAVLPTGIGPVTGGYQIERSLRFNSADSAYLNRTLGTSADRKKSTISFWVKRSTLTSAQVLFVGGAGTSDFTQISFNGSDQLRFYSVLGGTSNGQIDTVAVFRDVSAWYNICVSCDFANATAADRVKIYVNNVQQTVTTTTTVTNANHGINGAIEHRIGRGFEASPFYLNGYITECYFVDAQVLTPSSFGETDTNTGVWKPKAYTGTYGTNGFYLKFADNSNTTAATLGKDSSGNGNNWTPNNFSVTAGVGNDSLVDSPTSYGTDTGVGGSVRGNYCTLNPLNKSGGMTLSDGNLRQSMDSATGYSARGTIASSSGKWYAEAFVQNKTTQTVIGVCDVTMGANQDPISAPVNAVGYYANAGTKYVNGTSSAYGATYTTNDIIGIALDMDALTVTFYKNNTSQGSIALGTTGLNYTFFASDENFLNTQIQWNFGQRAFAYTAPSGFKALCTTNLPTPTIGATSTTQANDYFDALTYTGNGASPRSVTGVAFQPDLVWVKNRTDTWAHQLFDSVRGAGSTKALTSNGTDAEGTYGAWGYLSSFNSDGFTLTAGGTSNDQMNKNANTYVAWNWNAGGSNATNTAGTITSTVRANTTSGFSIVTYTGTGSSPQSIGHGLGATPSMIFLKSRGATSDWYVNHVSIGTNDLRLNSTGASAANNFFSAKSSTTFTINFNQTGDWVAYCFAPVAGYSAFGSYTGNSSADGPFVYTGFRPRYVMVKRFTGAGGVWEILDSSRDPYNAADKSLRANASDAEATGPGPIDFLSNGFKLRGTGGQTNDSGTYLYAAFAESPFKYSLAR
jgi:hypothetical protein